ncbi:hypothetical protein HDU96_004218 [Phlyctochytrium bullatum]|nr:hypothetical protein HDU96_004218 [Phlyctochytrium bullatum]
MIPDDAAAPVGPDSKVTNPVPNPPSTSDSDPTMTVELPPAAPSATATNVKKPVTVTDVPLPPASMPSGGLAAAAAADFPAVVPNGHPEPAPAPVSNPTPDVNHPSFWSGFHKKALKERQNQLRLYFPTLFNVPQDDRASSTSTASSLSTTPDHDKFPPSVKAAGGIAQRSPSTSPTRADGAAGADSNGVAHASLSRSTDSLVSMGANAVLPAVVSSAGLQRSLGLSLKRAYGSTASLAALDVGTLADEAFPIRGLDEQIANNMIENCVGTLGMPVGLALNFVINGATTVIPMAVEEPSVVAAVSGAAKTFGAYGGFKASTSERNIIFAQVVLADVCDALQAAETIRRNRDDLIALANTFVPGMVSRGGGVVEMTVRTPLRRETRMASRGSMVWGDGKSAGAETSSKQPEIVSLKDLLPPPEGTDTSRWLVVHFHLDVCDAMGANAASTVAEGVAPTLASMVRGTGPNGQARIGLRIVSNLCVERLSRATFRIPVPALGYKGLSGRVVAGRIIEATQWALDDPFRAATHNKGIMNGIDAVAVATGQDWRAIEASAHAWAAVAAHAAPVEGGERFAFPGDTEDNKFDAASGLPARYGYRPLTRYWVEREAGADLSDPAGKGLFFCGELEIPVSVGTRGGVLKTNPVFNYTLGMMGYPDSKQLAMAMAAVGLAQNFAALRALSTEGIQRGHMSLHARNIAIAAGAPPHAINECVAYMVESGRVNVAVAREYLQAHELHSNLVSLTGYSSYPTDDSLPPPNPNPAVPPSTFFFEESVGMAHPSPLEERISLNIAFQTLGPRPVHLSLVPTVAGAAATAASGDQVFVNLLFGEKGHNWISSVFSLLDRIEISALAHLSSASAAVDAAEGGSSNPRRNQVLARKLKILSALLNIVVRNMMAAHPKETRRFISHIAGSVVGREGVASRLGGRHHAHHKSSPLASDAAAAAVAAVAAPDAAKAASPSLLQVGRPLILALWQVFELRALQWIGHQPLATALLDAQLEVVMALVEIPAPSLSGLSAPAKKSAPAASAAGKSAAVPVAVAVNGAGHANGSTSASDDSDGTADDSDGLEMKGAVTAAAVPASAGGFVVPPRVAAVMTAHARRFQVSVFLLCDASTLDPSVLQTRGCVDLLRSVGSKLEWEQTCAHDLSPSRLARDLAVALVGRNGAAAVGGFPGISITGALGDPRGSVVNGFLAWLGARLGFKETGGHAVRADGGLAYVSARLVKGVEGAVAPEDEAVVALLKRAAGEEASGEVPAVKSVVKFLLRGVEAGEIGWLHRVLKPEVDEFLATVGTHGVGNWRVVGAAPGGAAAAGLFAADKASSQQQGLDALFGPRTLEKVTALYREYYEVTGLYSL